MPVEYTDHTGDSLDGDEKIVIEFGNLKLVLDQKEIYPEDPGQGTPAMIYLDTDEGLFTSTYWCWEQIGTVDDYRLTDSQLRFLSEKIDLVYKTTDEWYAIAESTTRSSQR
jgi:hypothetical protein